jgi:hypothetical protein
VLGQLRELGLPLRRFVIITSSVSGRCGGLLNLLVRNVLVWKGAAESLLQKMRGLCRMHWNCSSSARGVRATPGRVSCTSTSRRRVGAARLQCRRQ